MDQKALINAQKQVQNSKPDGVVLQRKCDKCRKKKPALQRSAISSTQETVPPIVHEVLRSPGQPLDAGTRAFMEPRFSHDFSSVRVHTDAKAAESARAVNALAYSVGNDVVFSAGQYSPDTDKGKTLMAHELTHVLQQEAMNHSTIEKKLEINDPGDESERQADRFADQAISNKGGILGNIAQAQISLQRACGRSEIGTVTDCLGQSGDVVGEVFHFRINCDTFSPAREDSRLRAFAATLGPDDIIEIHGFASIDGPADFNESLSCARAHKAESVLIEEGISPAQIRPLIMHGATEGNATERRSAVIQKQTAVPNPTAMCGPDATDWYVRQVNTAMTDADVLSIRADIAAADVLARRHGTTAQQVAEGGTATAVVAQHTIMGSSAPRFEPVISGQLTAGTMSGGSSAAALRNHPIDAATIGFHIGRASLNWRRLVNHGARYDFKAHTMMSPATAHCPDNPCRGTITLCPGAVAENCYLTDLPGNLFYARIGRFVGWSELTLQLGSQLAQLTGTGSWDPPQDTAAIHLGFTLPLPMSAAGLCGLLPARRGSLTSRSGCADCRELTTAAIV